MYKRSAIRAQLGNVDWVGESLFNNECIDLGFNFFYTPRDAGWKVWRFGGLDIDLRVIFLTLQVTATYRESSHDRGVKYMVHA